MPNDASLSSVFAPAQPTGPIRRPKSPLHRWWLTTHLMRRKAGRILGWRRLYALIVIHSIFYVADDALTSTGETIIGTAPRLIKGWRRDFAPCFLVFVGLNQTHWSGLLSAWIIARVIGFDAYLMSTPPGGNRVTVEEMVKHCGWLPSTIGDRPFYVYAFSKGGFDSLWLMSATGLVKQCRRYFGMSVPFRGTRMAEVMHSEAAKQLRPGSQTVLTTQRLLHELHGQGLETTICGGLIDIICPRSRCRPKNTDDYSPPPWWKLIWPRLTHALKGEWYSPPDEPWYWVKTVPQVGHTALFNPFAALTFGLLALHLERRRCPMGDG